MFLLVVVVYCSVSAAEAVVGVSSPADSAHVGKLSYRAIKVCLRGA